MAFIDLETAYDSVLRQECRGLRARGVHEKYLRFIQEVYRKVTTKVRCTLGMTESF
jgi:hypothetical protein